MTRKGISFIKKHEIIQDLSNGMRRNELSTKYGVSKSLISKLRHPDVQSKVQQMMVSIPNLKKKTRVDAGKFVVLERELLEWFVAVRTEKNVITFAILRTKALQIRAYLIENVADESTASLYIGFKASDCWLQKFRKRHDIKHLSIKGNEDNIAPTEIYIGRIQVKKSVEGYEPQDIFNVDETGLFYRQLPGLALVLGSLSHKEVTTSKDRITVMLCCSSMGEKLPL